MHLAAGQAPAQMVPAVASTSNSTDLNRLYVASRPAFVASNDTLRTQRQLQVSQAQFMSWLSRERQDVYRLLRAARPDLTAFRPLAGLGLMPGADQGGNVPAAGWFDSTLDFLKQAVPTYFQFQAQKDLIEVNLERAKQGLPPITADSVTPGVNVGVSGETRTLLYWAVGGLVVVGVFLAMKKGR